VTARWRVCQHHAMPRPLPPELVAPDHTALVVVECQNSVLGPGSTIPALAEEAHDIAIPNIARLLDAARAADVPVIHCTVRFRADGLGASRNAPLLRRAGPMGASRSTVPGIDAAAPIDELQPAESDIVLERIRGIGPMSGTDLDGVLRNLRVTTVVATGVSVNVAVTNCVMDSVNLGYDVVLPKDAVAGIPREYADAVIKNVHSFLTTLTMTDDLIAVWSAAG